MLRHRRCSHYLKVHYVVFKQLFVIKAFLSHLDFKGGGARQLINSLQSQDQQCDAPTTESEAINKGFTVQSA